MIDSAFAIVSGIAWIGVAIFIFCWNLKYPPLVEDRKVLNLVGVAAVVFGLFCLKLSL